MTPLPDHPGSPADASAGIAAERSFGTWSSECPAAMVWLPLGLSVIPVAYAASIGRTTHFPAGSSLQLGAHTPCAEHVSVKMDHADTQLDWRWDKVDAFTVRGGWATQAHGEWGLRFWVCLALDAPDGLSWSWDDQAGAAIVRSGHRWAVVVPDRAPLMVTGHDDLAGLETEFESRGYFFLESRTDKAPLLALRFNLEEAPRASFGFAVGDDLDETLDRARQQACANVPPPSFDDASPLSAVRDVMAWNTIFDPVNHRPYTALSRNWNTSKFGGFGVWLNDVLFSAMLGSTLSADMGRDNFLAVLAGATPQGNLPCLLTGNDAWIDRSQPPIAAFVLAQHILRWPDSGFVARALPVLLRNWEWWWRTRDPEGTGLVRYGTSALGHGLYRGTKLGAKDESAMDNSPVHDQATLDPKTGLLDSYDVGLNALLALEGEMLADLLAQQGHTTDAQAMHHRTEALKDAIRTHLWDPTRQVFANRLLDGRFVDSLAPTSFYPMIAGIPTPTQMQGLMAQLADPAGFGGAYRLPSVRRDDPAFNDGIYWRGRVWPPMNWYTWAGLRRMGQSDAATALAEESYKIFCGPWRAARQAAENFSADTGAATDQPDTDTFYAWSALMPAMAVSEMLDVTPWEGFSLTNGADASIGPLATPLGLCTLDVSDGVLRLIRTGSTVFESNIVGRFSQVSLSADRFRVTLPKGARSGYIKYLTVARTTDVFHAVQGGTAIDAVWNGQILTVEVQAVTSEESRLIDVIRR